MRPCFEVATSAVVVLDWQEEGRLSAEREQADEEADKSCEASQFWHFTRKGDMVIAIWRSGSKARRNTGGDIMLVGFLLM